MQPRCATAHNGWDPSFAALPGCESLFPPKRSTSSRRIRWTKSSACHRTVHPNPLARPPVSGTKPHLSSATHVPVSAPACSQLPLVLRDSRHAPAPQAWLLERCHPEPNRAALPAPSCVPLGSDPCARPTAVPYEPAHLAPVL